MKIKNLLCSFAALLTLSACDSEFDIPQSNADDNEVIVTYSVQLPDALPSRAFSDGTKAKELHYAVYEVDEEEESGSLRPTLSENVILSDLEADIQLRLIKNKNYEIAFWAQSPNAPYTYRDATQTVTVDYTNAYANDDDLDAFFGFVEVNADYSYGRTITLTRAVAQLNIGTTDLAKAKEMHINVNRSTISTTAYTKFNLKTKKVSDAQEITFKLADVPSEDEPFPSDNVETYVSMNYLFAPETDEDLASVTLNVDGRFARTFQDIPIKRNHRTNIYGNIFTDESSLKVKVLNDFDIEAWDGLASETPKGPNDENVIEIGEAADLARIFDRANTQGTTYNGLTIQLTKDIDLNGKPWDPISAEENIHGEGFQGTFDGNGYTIHNLYVDLDDLQTVARWDENDDGSYTKTDDEIYHYAGLFGQLTDATIKNVTIENVIIHAATAYQGNNGMYAGVIAGEASGTKFENITIRGTIIVTADGSLSKAKSGYAGGLVGAADYGCEFENIKIDAYGVSYVSASDCAHVGGVTGRYLGNNGYTDIFKNVSSNLNVIAANPLGKKTAVGGLIGEINNYTRKLESCSCSGTVTLNNYKDTLVTVNDDTQINAFNMGIGGLVGAGYGIASNVQAEFTSCIFTGGIYSNFISESGAVTDYTETVEENNKNWKYMGWIDSGQAWKTNDGCLTISN
jgi:hypothetical protein